MESTYIIIIILSDIVTGNARVCKVCWKRSFRLNIGPAMAGVAGVLPPALINARIRSIEWNMLMRRCDKAMTSCASVYLIAILTHLSIIISQVYLLDLRKTMNVDTTSIKCWRYGCWTQLQHVLSNAGSSKQ